jgi:hypothetical protein
VRITLAAAERWRAGELPGLPGHLIPRLDFGA